MKVVNKKTGHNTGDRIGNATYNPLILEKSIRPPPPTPQVNVNVNNETSDLDKIITQLKNMCELTGNSNEIITKQFTLLVDSIKTLKSDMNNIQISKLKNEHVIEINELKSKHKEELEKVIKANAVNKSDSQIKQLEQDKSKLENQVKQLETVKMNLETELTTTKSDKTKVEQELSTVKSNIAKLEQVITDKSKVEQELIEVRAELTTTNTKLVELKQINSELENDKMNLENVRINLTTQVKQLTEEKQRFESQVKQLTDLEAQYKFVSSALEEVKKELTKEKENHKHMIEKIEIVHKEEVDKIESELKQQKQQAENNYKEQIEKLKDEFKQQIDQLKESKQQVENNYKEQIEQLKDGFKSQIDKLKEEKQQAMTSLQVIEAEKKIIDNVNKDLEKRNQQNEIIIKNKETHIDELRLKADRESSELKLKIEKLESETQLDVELIERGLRENLENHFSTLFSKAKAELTEANEFIKKKVVNVKELIDEFISWFLEKVYNISEMSEQLKEELTAKLTKTNFISFIKDLIKHLKSLFKTRGYTELELAIAEYEDKLNETIPELKVSNEQRAITDDLKAMMTNVLNDIESMKQEINDMKSNELDLAPVVVEQHPQQQSAPVGVRALASSYEALGIDDRVRRLEVEIKFIKAKLDN